MKKIMDSRKLSSSRVKLEATTNVEVVKRAGLLLLCESRMIVRISLFWRKIIHVADNLYRKDVCRR